MRTQSVEVAGEKIVIRERKIKEIKEDLMPKLEPAWDAISKSDITSLVDTVSDQFTEIFTELKEIDIQECYPSEIEGFVEAWIDVNFSGLKRILGWLPSLEKAALPK